METSLEPWLATARSSTPSPLKSPAVKATGSKPTGKLAGRAEGAAGQAGIDQDVVAQPAGHHQVGDAVPVEIDQLDGAGGQQGLRRGCRAGIGASNWLVPGLRK